jgi:hypothetical protein
LVHGAGSTPLSNRLFPLRRSFVRWFARCGRWWSQSRAGPFVTGLLAYLTGSQPRNSGSRSETVCVRFDQWLQGRGRAASRSQSWPVGDLQGGRQHCARVNAQPPRPRHLPITRHCGRLLLGLLLARQRPDAHHSLDTIHGCLPRWPHCGQYAERVDGWQLNNLNRAGGSEIAVFAYHSAGGMHTYVHLCLSGLGKLEVEC